MNLAEAEDKLRLFLSGDSEDPVSQILEIINETDEDFYLTVQRQKGQVEHLQCWRVDKKTGACEQRPRWEAEEWRVTHPNPQACETCMFRPSEFQGSKLDRADTGSCQIYEYPDHKPNDVYWDGAECEFYEKA
jgi:hypothetical protein